MIRNLATMTRVGLLTSSSAATKKVLAEISNVERIRKARVHPIQILMAARTYGAGHGMRSDATWAPVGKITDALDAAFYTAFENIEGSGKRFLLALDVSGSMEGGAVAGIPGFTPRDASAAMALVTAKSEENYDIVGFTGGGYTRDQELRNLTPLNITPGQRLDDAIRVVSNLPFGGTDCALPMLYASKKKMEVDTFVVYTDSETWAGRIHPTQALKQYRKETGIPAKLIVVGMVANDFSIADPKDAGMLDVVGFDTATPSVISDFSK
jgi:60 kDa SS-A/Ro ribonucleoprotein